MKRTSMILIPIGLALLLAACSEDTLNEPGEETAALDRAGLGTVDALREAPTDKSCGRPSGTTTYEVVIENLTPATGEGASQPFSPTVAATHGRRVHIFQKGRYASSELAQVAEDAVNAPLVEMLGMSPRVADVAQGDGVILPGGEGGLEITTRAGARNLSLVFMLVNTNDAFGGLDAVRLPRSGERTYMVQAYDAGSEVNTELVEHIPGPCCGSPGMGVDERRRIMRHRGITGDGDLDPARYDWEGPVARVTIRRVNPLYQVTLENLTPETVPGGSQVFSPPVLATHNPAAAIFRVGRPASDELAALAEDGVTSGLEAKLGRTSRVWRVVTGDGPVPPGGTATYEIEGGPRARWLSLATMLVNTNDGFTGGDRVPLPAGGSVAYWLPTYDAGSELNTELIEHIPGPCCGNPGAGPDEMERIMPHEGITGVGDLDPAAYGWEDPAAKLTITRIR